MIHNPPRLIFILLLLATPLLFAQYDFHVIDTEGFKPMLAVDSQDDVHVVYILEGGGSWVKYGLWNAGTESFDIETVENGNFYGPAVIAVDASNVPHVNYHRHSPSPSQVYAVDNGASWSITYPDVAGHEGWSNSIVIDSNGYPRTSSVNPVFTSGGDATGIEYAFFDGSTWTVEPIGSETDLSYFDGTSIALDSNDDPHIAYYNPITTDLMYATKSGSWSISIVESSGDVGRFPSLEIDASGNPHISYYESLTPTTGVVKYAAWNGSSWDIEDIDTLDDVFLDGTSGARNMTNLEFDGNGTAHVAYSDQKTFVYAVDNGSGWDTETIVDYSSGNAILGQSAGFDLDSNDDPHFAYFDAGTSTLNWYVEPEPATGTPTIVVLGTAISDFENDTLRFHINEGIVGYDQPLNIRNIGDADLVWSITDEDSLGADCPNISVAPDNDTTTPGATTQIIVSMIPNTLIKNNTYYCDMLISSNDPATPVYTITVCIDVLEKYADFSTEVQSIPPGQPIAPQDSIRDIFTFTNFTGADQTVMIETKWLRNTGQEQQQMNPRFPDLTGFEVNSNRNKKFEVPASMPLGINWVVSYIYTPDGVDTLCTDTAEFEVVSAEFKQSVLNSQASFETPTAFALSKNYPNPFNPSTVIQYQVPSDVHVKLNIYNVAGQLVRSAINGNVSAGSYNYTWDGKNNQGVSVASGIYIYRMEADGFVQSHKMLLTK